MAGRTRVLAALVALAASGVACSSASGEVDLSSVTVSTTVTVTTAPTTTVASITTLSERAIAEAEVEALVTEFWLSPFDTSTGELRLEYLTGLPARRLEEGVQQLEAQGQLIRNQGQESIQVTSVEVDLEAGEGEITACTGESGERLDAETMERIVEAADPEYLTTTVFYFQLTPDGWKISEFVGSVESESPELCEIKRQ